MKGGVQKAVALVAAESFFWPVADGERLETRLEFTDTLTAPLTAGSKVGQAVFILDGEEIGRVDLLCGESVAPKAESALAVLKLAR